ncbi:hypothetical protein OROMI_024692 [Orobanche minor]
MPSPTYFVSVSDFQKTDTVTVKEEEEKKESEFKESAVPVGIKEYIETGGGTVVEREEKSETTTTNFIEAATAVVVIGGGDVAEVKEGEPIGGGDVAEVKERSKPIGGGGEEEEGRNEDLAINNKDDEISSDNKEIEMGTSQNSDSRADSRAIVRTINFLTTKLECWKGHSAKCSSWIKIAANVLNCFSNAFGESVSDLLKLGSDILKNMSVALDSSSYAQ